ATVTIYTLEHNNVLTVQVQALNFRPDSTLTILYYFLKGIQGKLPHLSASHIDENYIRMKNIDGRLNQQKISTGASNGVEVEITKCLKPGEVVVLGMNKTSSAQATVSEESGSPFMPKRPHHSNKKATTKK